MYEDARVEKEWAKNALPWYMQKIRGGVHRYEEVEELTGVPWNVVAVIHGLEAGFRFDRHLHNGDPLDRKTVQIPRGRPRADSWTWETSAADALRHDHLEKVNWDDLEQSLYALEAYNGLGYSYRKRASPYLWGGSQYFDRGKYVSDGKFDANAETRQIGAALLLKESGWN